MDIRFRIAVVAALAIPAALATPAQPATELRDLLSNRDKIFEKKNLRNIPREMRAVRDIAFSGDGEPQHPQLTVERLGALLEGGRLQPDTYSLGGTVAEFESRMATELGKEAAIWLPTVYTGFRLVIGS